MIILYVLAANVAGVSGIFNSYKDAYALGIVGGVGLALMKVKPIKGWLSAEQSEKG